MTEASQVARFELPNWPYRERATGNEGRVAAGDQIVGDVEVVRPAVLRQHAVLHLLDAAVSYRKSFAAEHPLKAAVEGDPGVADR